jgi:hypothetical protein
LAKPHAHRYDDEDVRRAAAELVAELIDGHLADRRATLRRTRTAPPPQRGAYVTVFNAGVYAPVHIGGPSADPDIARVQSALHDVLRRLPETGLTRPAARNVRRLLGRVSTALVTSAASGGATPVVQELVRGLQHVVI